ncbi:uncharacterized protein B0P05DRAFT_566963 [Gilbertella persicaria]|uniref:uncharacterized protein n=1 Tax=Gilbertella persicaria TaxID=101096 RepID=UPI002220CAE8|nr:uncharacterized protein B0P05DRAFT_566963 [Gilbertella persicaria]KAI8047082.1 hypothetical protein B0P05DRAFT_566963 [Gilbertella persicaria]
MTGTLRWHSCSTTDFPLKRHKVSKACEACRNKKMRCDGKHPCQRCENNKMECKYNDRPIRSRTLKPLCIETNLDKITLTNEIHETFRLSRPHHGTCLSPLLFDFFHLTSQPAHIWRLWTEYHQNLRASASSIEWMMSKNQLVKEAFKLFVTHNLLYGTLIHSQMLAFVLQSDSVYAYLPSRPQHHSLISPRPSLTHPPSNDYDAVVIYSVLALVFSSLPEEHENLMEDAMTLYKKAHALFIQLCFPATFSDPAATVPNQKEIEWMVLASILLAHFQCAVIHPEQAYLTIRILPQ